MLGGAVFALGAAAAFALQAELHGWLAPPARRPLGSPPQDATLRDCRPGHVFESWMNEFPLQYDPVLFRWSLTRPVFVRLEGSVLTLWGTTARVPRKALWNEAPLDGIAPLVQRRQYDLEGVRLLPEDMKRSKLWSRKYPICVLVRTGAGRGEAEEEAPHPHPAASHTGSREADPPGLDIAAEVHTLEEAEDRLLERLVSEEITRDLGDEDDVMSDVIFQEVQKPSECTLFLFARSSRQKEEWYQRLRRALGHPSTLSDAAFGEYLACLEPYLTGDHPNPGLNALIGRILYDATRSPRLRAAVKETIQRKLTSLKMPALMERPVVDDLTFGETFLEVIRTGAPMLDVAGLWVDMEISYRGAFRIRITTKLNLSQEVEQEGEEEWDTRTTRSRNWPSFLKTLCENRFFHAALTALSNTDIVLSVELQSVQGILAVNLPPPPSDRLWLGFRGVPAVHLEAVPRVGSRALRHSLVCRLIEVKLRSYLESVFVLPNMQNVLLSFMNETDQ